MVRLIGRGTKVGHTGTLDPLATGVLLVVVGSATRLVDYAHRLPKQYRGDFMLGRVSDSLDLETEVVELANQPRPTRDEIAEVVPSFLGQITQRPPVYSAVKVAGREAYKRVREGETIEMPSRRVLIDAIEIVASDYPLLGLDIRCGSGTYIRTLGDDIAKSLGTRAVMSRLERTAIGSLMIEDAVSLESLTTESIGNALINPIKLLPDMPRLELTGSEIVDVRNGRFVPACDATASELAAVDGAGRLVAILRLRPSGNLGPVLVFN